MKKELLCFGVASLVAAQYAQSKPAKDTRRPNVVFIFADDLGYGDISCNGATAVRTPNVDRIASAGLRLTNAHATAATSTPSRYSVLTGEYAWRRPGTGVAPGDAAMIVTPDRYTLPDMMRGAGYRTAAVGKWHLGLGSETGKQDWNKKITPALEEIGFDYSYIMAATGDRVPCVYIEDGKVVNLDPSDPIAVSYKAPFEGEPTGRKNPELLNMKSSHGHDQALINGVGRIGYMTGGKAALWNDSTIADVITEKAIDFIERSKDVPFFLYFATNDIHVPRVPHQRFVGKSGMGARGDAILSFDWSVGCLLDKLEELGLMDNTLIVLTSDNGPVVDDGYQDQAVELLGNHRPAAHLRGGKYSNFEAGTRVPTLVRWDGHVKKGSVSNAAVSQIDLFASLAALVDGRMDIPQAAPDSQNQLAAWTGKDKKGRMYVVENASSNSIVVGDWKYIRSNKGAAYYSLTDTESGNDPKPQLYNLKKDIGEKNNLADLYPQQTKKMAQWLEQIEKGNDATPVINIK